MVDIFPITSAAFGFSENWFERYSPKLIEPSYLLMVLLLIVSVGILALKRFETTDLEKKIWNLGVIVVAVAAWPSLILGLKDLIDSFNTFLVKNIFNIPWIGFGFAPSDETRLINWPYEAISRLFPNIAYWVIYAFYITFIFLYTVLGPFVIAKGILTDEVDNFLELILEISILFLWQTIIVVLVAFVMPDIVSGKPFPKNPETNMYFLSFILGLLIFFTPAITRKFVIHLGFSFFPPGTRMGATLLTLGAVGRIGSMGLRALGAKGELPSLSTVKQTVLRTEDFASRYHDRRQIQTIEHEKHLLAYELEQEEESFLDYIEGPHSKAVNLFKRAKSERERT